MRNHWAGEMAPHIRALPALVENSYSVSNMHMVAPNHP